MSNAVAEGKTRRSMIIPDDMWSDLELVAARNYTTVTAEVIRAVVEYLARQQRKP